MAVKLLTGATGDGKTHLAVKWILEARKEGRPVFTNIKGINEPGFEPIEGVEPIPRNARGELDWQLCPEADSELGIQGALVIYDEAQKQKDQNDQRYFAWKGREKLSERAVISELDEHRHKGYDIIFITQEPNLLHLHLLGFVKEHYHCARPLNKSASQVALWRSWQTKPNSQSAIERAEDVFEIPLDPKIFKHYKSTEMVTDKKIRIPKYMFKIGAIAVVALGLSAVLFGNIFFHFGDGHRIGQDSINANLEKQKKQNTQVPESADKNFDVALECRKAINVDKTECKEWFNSLTAKNQSVPNASLDSQTMQVTYNVNQPFKDDIQKNLTYEVTSKPKFSGCSYFNGKYQAYTEQGTKLNVSKSDCIRLIRDNDRPYDYFKEKSNQLNANNISLSPNDETIDHIKQPDQYIANNYVEPHLQAKVTNGANDQAGFNNAF